MDEDDPKDSPEPIEATDTETPAEEPAPLPSPSPRDRNTWKKLAIPVVIVLLILGGYYLFKPEHHTVGGTIAVIDSVYASDSLSTCSGQGGYDDMHDGTQIVVKNQAGSVIATGSLDKGITEHDPNACLFAFAVTVPGAAFYSFEIGHRTPVSYSKADMAKNKWVLALTLGN